MKFLDLFRRQASPFTAKRAPLASALEPRMMFDGAIAATAAEAASSAEHPTTDPAKTQTADDSTQPASDAATPPAASSDQRQEIVFVDGKLQDYQQLVSEIKPGTEVVVLDGSRGGLQQIADYLNGRSGIDAIHLLSHGEAGVFRAGSDWIDANALAAQSATLARIGAALSENGDILLYGCKTGEGAAGAALVNELARLTQADVAASSDNTGALALGGDWVLETRSGSIDSIALAPTAFSGLLAAPTSLNFDSVNLDADGDGDPTSSLGESPRVFDGWTVTLNNSAGAIVTEASQGYLDVTNNRSFNDLVDDGGDKALTVTGLDGSAASARFTATSGEEFWLQSFVIQNLNMNSGVRVEGYREGGLVASHNFTLNSGPGVYSTITLDHLGDQDWQNIDQFRIVQQNGIPYLWFAIDDIVVASKVLPNTPPTATNLTQSKEVTEGGSAVALDDIVVSDPDTGDNITATLTLSSPAAGGLSTGTFGSATSTYDDGTGVWTISGSRTEVNAALAAVTLTPTADNEQNFTISTRIHDAANSGPADGTISVTVTSVNDAPSATNLTQSKTVTEGGGAVALSDIVVSDPDTGDNITATLTLSSPAAGSLSTGTFGSATSTYDAGTGVWTISGSRSDVNAALAAVALTPSADNDQNFTISTRIRDAAGTGPDDGSITVSVTAVNDAPTVANPIPNQAATEEAAFSFQFASNTFNDVDSSSLTYSAQRAGGGALPTWLSFDPSTGTFSGTPANGDVGTLSIDVIASDGNGGSVTDTFDIVVANTNVPPILDNPIADQTATEDTAFKLVVPSNTFSDPNDGDTLSYTAQLAGGNLLPAWLSFDPSTRTFSGTPANGDVGTLSIDLIADDGNGGRDTDTFDIVVANTNDAPTVANPIPNQTATEDAAFNFQFAINTFSDPDVGDTLSYTAQLAGGGLLPAWLSFDPDTRTFSGTPANGHVGTLSIDVIADDSNGGRVTDTFDIVVANTNDAPIVANPIPNQTATEDAAFNFQFAFNTFNDADVGDTLTYTAQLAGGGALPAWLSFDPATRTFSGTPANGDVGTLSIDLIADDGAGGTVTDTFNITVTNVNDAPTVTISETSYSAEEQVPINLHGTGISVSDIDSTSLTVTLTGAGSNSQLAATVGTTGVTIFSGNGTNTLVLTGTTAQLNALFAGDGGATLTYLLQGDTPAATRLLTISASDGSLSGNDTAIVNITAVNDAPVNSVPAAQSVDQDANLVFNSGNGNLISISDVDAGSGHLGVTLIANNGLLTLGGTTGLTFTTGDGSSDATMTFTGSIADINNALNGLSFSPATGYNGAASLQISTSDLGLYGSGGTQVDTDTIQITVNPIKPVITAISSSNADGTYKVGDTITISITFDEVVTVDTIAGSPTLLLETGPTDRIATYVSGSGNKTLTFSYRVQAGDSSADLDYASTSALSLNGGTIKDGANQNAILTLAAPGAAGSLGTNKALVVDGVRPAATSITLSDTALSIGQTATVTITFNERVSGLGTSDFTVANGSLSNFSSSDSGLTWTATFTPSANVSDATNLITLDNTGVMDEAGNIGSGTTDSGNYAIDTESPTASIVIADTELKAGQSTTVTITFSEAVSGLTTADFSAANGALSNLTTSDNITWTATLTPDASVTDATNLITLDNTGYTDIAGNPGGAPTDSINYAIDTQRPTAISVQVADTALKAGQSTTVTITFSETVSGLDVGDFSVTNGTLSNLSSSDGGLTWTTTLTPAADVTDATNLITLDNTGYTDAAGNTGTGTTDSNNYAIDTQRPTTTSVLVADTALKAGQSTTVTITFSEAVSGLTTADFSVANGTLSNLSSSDGGLTWTATLTPDADVTDATNLITLDNTGYTNAAGNTGTDTNDSNNYAIDSKAPTVTSVGVPANGTYASGQNLDFTVNFDEAVLVNTSNGTPRLAITLDTGGTVYADYLSGSGNSALVFRLTVASGQLDSNGISIGSSIDSNGGSLRDASGNDSNTTLNSVGSTSGVLVDTVAPQVTAISLDDASPTSASSVSFTLTFSEGVSGVDLGDLNLNTSGSVSASLKSVVQIDAHTYRVTVDSISGVGSLSLSLNATNSAIVDGAGNSLTSALSSQTYSIVETAIAPAPAPVGDPEFLSSMGATPAVPPAFTPPAALEMPGGLPGSPLLPPPLFEVRTVGGDLPPLGTIFLGNSSSSPSFIAQVFGSSDTGLGGDGQGFLGFGAGDSGIFGSSTFATIFDRDVPGVSEMNVFSGSQWKQSDLNQGLRGVFGAPTFGQQLHELHEDEQRQLRELALALGQLEGTPTQA